MIAAIYARKSTEQNAVAEEEKSVTRQVEHAKGYAEQKGWTVADEHVYVDDGISGAEFVKRPGFLRLMNALTPRPSFQVLVMSEESRLGREQIATAYALKQIMDAGVRVFFYLENRERVLDTALDKVMLSLSGFAAEMEREKAAQRTYDAMMRKAKAGHVVGNRVYGYDNVPVGEPRQYVVRRINGQEKDVVLRIYREYAAGTGLKRIAKNLNADHVPPRRGGPLGWAPSCVREILHRDLYAGVVWWNRTQTIQRGGTKKQIKRKHTDWVRLDTPELRIVPDDLWQQVQARHERNRRLWVRDGKGHLQAHPSVGDLESRYLLSGFAECAVCGGRLVGMSRNKGTRSRTYYACVYHHNRGRTVCANNLRISEEALDSAILHALNAVIDEQVLEKAVEHALAQLRAGQVDLPDRRTAILRELSLIEARLKHLVNAIANGNHSEAVYGALKAEEERKKVLTVQLADLAELGKLASLDAKRLARRAWEKLADVRGMLGKHTPQARQMLRKLLDGRIMFTPFEENGVRGYRYQATGTYGRLFAAGLVAVNDGGGGHGSRTRDPDVANVVLSQLS